MSKSCFNGGKGPRLLSKAAISYGVGHPDSFQIFQIKLELELQNSQKKFNSKLEGHTTNIKFGPYEIKFVLISTRMASVCTPSLASFALCSSPAEFSGK